MDEAMIQALRGKYPAEGEVGRRVSRLGGPAKAQGLYEEYAGLGMPDFLAAFEEQTKEAESERIQSHGQASTSGQEDDSKYNIGSLANSVAAIEKLMHSQAQNQKRLIETAVREAQAKASSSLSLASQEQQGASIIEAAKQSDTLILDDFLPSPQPSTRQQGARILAAVNLEVERQIEQWNAEQKNIKPEDPPQLMLQLLIPKILQLRQGAGTIFWDTHKSPCRVSKAQPDAICAFMDEEPAAVITYTEAKPNLSDAKHLKKAAFQMLQRREQFADYQNTRSIWWGISCSQAHVDVWRLQEGKIQRTGVLPLKAEERSQGLEALLTVYLADKESLGFADPARPEAFSLGNTGTVTPGTRISRTSLAQTQISIHATTIYRAVLRAHSNAQSEPVIIKSSILNEAEISAYAAIASKQEEAKWMMESFPKFYGVGQAAGRQWLVLEDCGQEISQLREPVAILFSIFQASYLVGRMAELQAIHGDLSVKNLCCKSGKLKAIDLATMRNLETIADLRVSEITGTPPFLAINVTYRNQQDASTELESLLYILIWLALSGKLPWEGMVGDLCFYTKVGCMSSNPIFEDKVATNIESDLLRSAVRSLRNLFFENGNYRTVSCEAFVQCILKVATEFGLT